MSIRNLLKRYPKSFISRTKIWTPKRSTLEFEFHHDELVGMLLVQLCARTEALNGAEREAMQNLLNVFQAAE